MEVVGKNASAKMLQADSKKVKCLNSQTTHPLFLNFFLYCLNWSFRHKENKQQKNPPAIFFKLLILFTKKFKFHATTNPRLCHGLRLFNLVDNNPGVMA
jgi:hypothetical protein